MGTTELGRLAREIAARLPGDWMYVAQGTEHPIHTIEGAGGQCLQVAAISWPPADKGKLRISGRIPQRDKRGSYVDAGVKCPEIKVRADRGPLVIAREISRRLLGPLVEANDKITDAVESADSYIAETEGAFKRFAELFPGLVSCNGENARREGKGSIYHAGIYGSVEVRGAYVDLKIRSLTHGRAAEILRIVDAWESKSEGERERDSAFKSSNVSKAARH